MVRAVAMPTTPAPLTATVAASRRRADDAALLQLGDLGGGGAGLLQHFHGVAAALGRRLGRCFHRAAEARRRRRLIEAADIDIGVACLAGGMMRRLAHG